MGQLGSNVLQQLRQQAGKARARAFAAEATAKHARDQLAKLTSQRMQALQELAMTQLPELNADTAARAMPEIAAELQAVERERQRRSEQIEAQLLADQASLLRESDQLEELTGRLDEAVVNHDRLMQEVAERLQKNSEYCELAQRAQQADVGLARDMARQQEIDAEAAQKLPAYEHGRLFQYLWRRDYGTNDYGSRGFTRRMDRRLARFIDYDDAVISYRFLTATPELVRLEVVRRSELANSLSARVEAIEDAVEVELGVPAARNIGGQLGTEREAKVVWIADLQQRIANGYQALRDEVGSRGKFHAQALRELTGYLSRAEAMTLEQRARETEDATDDRLVAKLRSYAVELERVASGVPELERGADKLDAVADSFDELVNRFVQSEFDSGRSRFRSSDVMAPLRRLERGDSDVNAVWRELQGEQFFEPPPITRHRTRSNNAMSGLGIALDIIGSVARVASRNGGGFSIGRSSSSRSSGHRASGHHSSGGGFSSSGGFGGGGGFSTGGGFGGGHGGGGFTTGGGF